MRVKGKGTVHPVQADGNCLPASLAVLLNNMDGGDRTAHQTRMQETPTTSAEGDRHAHADTPTEAMCSKTTYTTWHNPESTAVAS